jgi:hypothetical protein
LVVCNDVSLTLQVIKKTREREREREEGEGENSFCLSERFFKQFDVTL